MANSYSIAEARDQLARLVHQAEKGVSVELTRRGKAVAVLVLMSEFKKLSEGNIGFWEAFERFRNKADLANIGISGDFRRSSRSYRRP